MGINAHSVHFRGGSKHGAIDVIERLRRKDPERAAIVTARINGWISVFPNFGWWEDSMNPAQPELPVQLSKQLGVRSFSYTILDDHLLFFDVCNAEGRMDPGRVPDREWDGSERFCIRGTIEGVARFAARARERRAIERVLGNEAQGIDQYVFASDLVGKLAPLLGLENALDSFQYMALEGEIEHCVGWKQFVFVGRPEPDSWAEKYFGPTGGRCKSQ